MDNKKEQLIEIVGTAYVADDPATLNEYAKDNSFTPAKRPSFVVKPKTVQEVQLLVGWANAAKTPLTPVSSGAPHFRGDTVPEKDDSVIVDMSRMNKIIRIDSRNRIVIIEPGVTYAQLQPELAKAGLKVSMPLMPRYNKSVIASLLEREPLTGSRYQWSLMEPLRCLEVVWGDGSMMWTGEAGEYVKDLDKQEEIQRSAVVGMGPNSVDYYRFISAAQGSMAIVTWASIKCEILPSVHKVFYVTSEKLESLLDFAYEIEKIRYGDEMFIVNRSQLAYMLGEDGDGVRKIRENLPTWTLLLGIAGRRYLPEERVDYQSRDISQIAKNHNLELAPEIQGVRSEKVLECLEDTCSGIYWKLRYKGNIQDIFFMTTLDKTPGFVDTMLSAADEMLFDKNEVGVYIQPQQQGCVCHCEFSLPYNDGDAEKIEKVFLASSRKLMDKGAYFSRPYGIWADLMYKRDENNTMLLKRIKNLFDPNGIMNPGKLCFKGE